MSLFSEMSTIHQPVLFDEVIEGLLLAPGKIIFDGTLGGGGHTIALAQSVGPTGLVIACDRDIKAIDTAEQRIRAVTPPLSVRLAHANYRDFAEVLEMLQVPLLDGVLLDLGLSSDQLADPSRGFSFNAEGELDLRFDRSEGAPAWELLNRWSAEKIADVIYQFGEERFSRQIARAIVQQREEKPIRMAAELSEICRRCVRSGPPGRQRIDPATRTFQALRIAINEELESLELFLRAIPQYLRPGGRIAIISFHSLEDRIVKNQFRDSPTLKIITKKPIEASARELDQNPRARSAKLRIAEKIQEDSSLSSLYYR